MRFISLIAFMVSIIAGGSTFLTPPESMPDKLSPILRNEAPVDSLMQYFRYINQAGRQIYRNNFLQASLCYDSAFLYNKHPFYVDVKNDILVNSKCGRFDRNTACIRLLMKDKQIDTAYLFAELPLRVFSDGNLKNIYNLQKKYHAGKKKWSKLQQDIHEMFTLDQNVRDYQPYNMRDKEINKQVYNRRDSTDTENARRFIQICTNFGFPSEEKIGVYYQNDLTWTNAIYILLWHFTGSKPMKKDIITLIAKEFHKGNIHPSLYASLCEVYNQNVDSLQPDFNFMNTTVYLINGVAYRPFVYYSDSLMRQVNTNRISIGLDSFHITQKQVICGYFYKAPEGHIMIRMSNYPKIEAYPYGLVKYTFEQENEDMDSYKINTEKILLEGKCEEKCY